jgi:hypothetical protein
MRKPNYSMERKDRDRAKQIKAAAKLEKRAAKTSDNRDESVPGDGENEPANGLPATKAENG